MKQLKVLLFNGSPNKEGCTYTALKEIADTLKTEGIEWTAISEGDSFEPGDLVEIVSVSGNTFTVRKLVKKG